MGVWAPQEGYRVVTCMGGVWYVSKRKWKRYLHMVASGVAVSLDDFGIYLGDITNVTDITDIRATELLAEEVSS